MSDEVSEERKRGREEMRKAAVAVINRARELGESDLRQSRDWIQFVKLDADGKIIKDEDEEGWGES